MTNLTEYSWYYCKMNDGDIRMLERGADYFLDGDVPLLNNEVKSVLAEVPSYEEWQDQVNATRFYADEFFASCDENAKLKELLKRCKRIIEIDEYVSITGAGRDILWDLLQDLKQVLGEE